MFPGPGAVSAAHRESGILHLLLSADSAAARDCGACGTAADTVVILDEGVMSLPALMEDDRPWFAGRVVVAESDLRARGLPGGIASGLELVDDDGIVALIESHRHCLSWA